jgi:precorrin-6A synthase
MQARPHRIIEIRDPERDRLPGDYGAAVAAWHEERTALYEQAIRDELNEDECGAFLVWGDPSLYDSTLRIIDQVAARRAVDFEWEIIPGITSIQALAARHRISLNDIGGAIHITTGRRLRDEHLADGGGRTPGGKPGGSPGDNPGGNPAGANVLVMLDSNCSFKALVPTDIDIYWGAYLGTPDEILLSGKLSELSAQIEQVRAHARNQKGWIMDTYLLRKRGTSSC